MVDVPTSVSHITASFELCLDPDVLVCQASFEKMMYEKMMYIDRLELVAKFALHPVPGVANYLIKMCVYNSCCIEGKVACF